MTKMKIKKTLITILASLLPFSGALAKNYKIIVDKNMDMYSGASLLTSTYKAVTSIEDKVGDKIVEKTPKLNPFVRLSKIALNVPLGLYLTTWQHEYFGHGLRIREFGGDPKVTVNAPFFGGYTEFDTKELPDVARDPTKRLVVTTAGLEANLVLANTLQEEMLVKGYTPYEAILYILNKGHSSFYIYKTPNPSNRELFEKAAFSGHDIAKYLYKLNQKYNGDSNVKYEHLVAGAVFQILDPTIVKIMTHDIKKYLGGKEKFHLPKFMVGTDLYLMPIGPEYSIDFFLRKENRLFKLKFGYGFGGDKQFYRIGAGVDNLNLTKKTFIDVYLEGWKQENMGGLIKLGLERKISDNFSLVSDIGYKTEGFSLGRRFDKGGFCNFGIKINLDKKK